MKASLLFLLATISLAAWTDPIGIGNEGGGGGYIDDPSKIPDLPDFTFSMGADVEALAERLCANAPSAEKDLCLSEAITWIQNSLDMSVLKPIK